jgi:hypothetical protein
MNNGQSIFKKIKEQLSLRNRYFYWSTFIFLIAILTWINNYGFYSHVERTSVRTAIQFEKSVLEIMANYPNQNKEEIQQLIIKLASKWQHFAYYNNGVEIILLNNEIKKIKDTKNWDNTTSSKFVIDINKLINKEEGGFFVESLTSHSQILDSIIKFWILLSIDIYNDIFQKRKSSVDGKIYIKNKESVNDGIIVIKNQDTDIERKCLLIEDKNNKSKEINLSPYEEILVKDGSIILKDQLISQGSIHTAIYNIQNIYWYRSRITIGFAIFTYLILWISRKRTYKLEELQEKEDLKIKETFQEDLKNNIEIKNTTIIQDKITKYDAILNPPINTLKFENLFDDLDTIGTKFRKVTEKIIFKVYEEQIGKRPLRMSLSTAVYELHEKGILSDTAKNYISIVRVYGNISSHYSDSTICREEAIAIASSLLNVIDEIYEKNLLK